MTIQSLLGNVLVQTGANIISNLAWFVVIYWAVKTIVKEVPHWLQDYESMKNRQRAIDNALSIRRPL